MLEDQADTFSKHCIGILKGKEHTENWWDDSVAEREWAKVPRGRFLVLEIKFCWQQRPDFCSKWEDSEEATTNIGQHLY